MPHLWSPSPVMTLKSHNQCSEAIGRITDTESGLKTRFSVFPVGFFFFPIVSTLLILNRCFEYSICIARTDGCKESKDNICILFKVLVVMG